MVDVILLFLIYSFIGWCGEVVFHAVITGAFVNRGFLNGPLCPVYGFGALLILYFLEPLKFSGPLLFLASMILTSLLEALTGFLLEKLFHARLWDYSDEPFHVGPYVCLRFSLMWGFACVFVAYLLHPFLAGTIALIPRTAALVISIVLLALLLADAVASVLTAKRLNRQLGNLARLAEEIHEISDKIGEKISDSTLGALEWQQQSKTQLAEYKERQESRLEEQREQWDAWLEELSKQLEAHKVELQLKLELSARKSRHHLKAFPSLRSKEHQGTLAALRDALNRLKKD